MKTTALLLSVIAMILAIESKWMMVKLIEATNNNIPAYVCGVNVSVVEIKGNRITCQNISGEIFVRVLGG